MGRASVAAPRAGGGAPTVGTCPAAVKVGKEHINTFNKNQQLSRWARNT